MPNGNTPAPAGPTGPTPAPAPTNPTTPVPRPAGAPNPPRPTTPTPTNTGGGSSGTQSSGGVLGALVSTFNPWQPNAKTGHPEEYDPNVTPERSSEVYKTTSWVSRLVNRVLMEPTMLLSRMITLRGLTDDTRKKIMADPHVHKMLRAFDRAGINTVASLAPPPFGPVFQWFGLGTNVLKTGNNPLTGVKRRWTVATTLLGAYPIAATMQLVRDIPTILSGLKATIGHIRAERSVYEARLKPAINLFIGKPVRGVATAGKKTIHLAGKSLGVVTYPVRHPLKTIGKMGRGFASLFREEGPTSSPTRSDGGSIGSGRIAPATN